LAATPPSRPRDLVVVSDLHLGRGFDRSTKRYHRLEAFFYDHDFRAFCAWLCDDARRRGEPFTLILNGDVFDLLRIEPEEVGEDGTRREKRYGPLPTPPIAARMVADILAGHPEWVEALCDVLYAGHDLVLISGNHDLELQWPQVQEELRHALHDRLAARGHAAALERLRFEPWFVYEPGRIWIEHGCQYDPENAFRYSLRSKLAGSPLVAELAERDMPLGNFFQRYLYNAFGSISFIVPSTRANYRYFRFLLANQPRLLYRVARSQGRFMLQLLRRMARPPDPELHRAAQAAHDAELEELAERSGLGHRLREIEALRFQGTDTARAVYGIGRQVVKLAIGSVMGAVLVIALLTASAHAIDSLAVGFGLKALLSLVLYVSFGALAAVALVAAAVRLPPDESPRPLRLAAARIAALLDVPIVTFGHSHEEVVSRSGGAKARWYFNTGTWLAVFSHDVLVPRPTVQYTFLRVRGHEGELLQWSPGRADALPIVLLEDDGAAPDPVPEPAPGHADEEPPRRRSA
jgi:UDP-2,3-diacylglucosamine pyrophosphatase LpxH